jgi:hypothetical protein
MQESRDPAFSEIDKFDWLACNGKAVSASKLLGILLPSLSSSELVNLLESHKACQVNDGEPGELGEGEEDSADGGGRPSNAG